MANTVKLKMKCVQLSSGTGGRRERVVLHEVHTNDATQHSGVVADEGPRPKGVFDFELSNASAKGQFKIDQAYSLSFTEVT